MKSRGWNNFTHRLHVENKYVEIELKYYPKERCVEIGFSLWEHPNRSWDGTTTYREEDREFEVGWKNMRAVVLKIFTEAERLAKKLGAKSIHFEGATEQHSYLYRRMLERYATKREWSKEQFDEFIITI